MDVLRFNWSNLFAGSLAQNAPALAGKSLPPYPKFNTPFRMRNSAVMHEPPVKQTIKVGGWVYPSGTSWEGGRGPPTGMLRDALRPLVRRRRPLHNCRPEGRSVPRKDRQDNRPVSKSPVRKPGYHWLVLRGKNGVDLEPVHYWALWEGCYPATRGGRREVTEGN